eukprot:c17866_g1_i1 orf=593-1030(+)
MGENFYREFSLSVFLVIALFVVGKTMLLHIVHGTGSPQIRDQVIEQAALLVDPMSVGDGQVKQRSEAERARRREAKKSRRRVRRIEIAQRIEAPKLVYRCRADPPDPPSSSATPFASPNPRLNFQGLGLDISSSSSEGVSSAYER